MISMIYQSKESIDENIKISKKIFAENKTSTLLKPQEKDFHGNRQCAKIY